MVNLNNITGKMTKNADKIGVIAGSLIRGYEPIIDNVMALVSGQGHVPDIGPTIRAFFDLPELKPTALLWIIGWGAKEFGYGKYGTPIQKFSEGMFKGMALQHVLYHSTHAGQGSAGNPSQGMFNRVVVAANQSGYPY